MVVTGDIINKGEAKGMAQSIGEPNFTTDDAYVCSTSVVRHRVRLLNPAWGEQVVSSAT